MVGTVGRKRVSRPASKAYSVAPPCASLASRPLCPLIQGQASEEGTGPGMCSVEQLLGGIAGESTKADVTERDTAQAHAASRQAGTMALMASKSTLGSVSRQH